MHALQHIMALLTVLCESDQCIILIKFSNKYLIFKFVVSKLLMQYKSTNNH